ENKLSNYNSTLGLFYQYDDDTFTLHSQSLTYLAHQVTNSEVINIKPKKIKLSDKGSFTKPFFNFYKCPRAQPEEKTITKAKYMITKISLENKSIEELKNPSQQTIETVLLKPHSASKQKKLMQDIIKLFISCTLPLSLIENKNFHTFLHSFDSQYEPPCVNTIKNEIANRTFYTTQVIKQILYTQTDTILEEFHMRNLTLGVIEMGVYKTANDIVESIEPMLKEFDIDRNKILSIITDNGSNIKTAIT
ncbi:13748_t:CDS:2, partial [Racocetra persica]